MYSALMSAGLLIASGASFPLYSKFSRAAGLHTATRIGLLSTAFGILAVTIGSVPWGLVTGCLLTGFGSFGEWTPSAEMTRRALSPTRLWRGMRIHSSMFYVGGILAVLTASLNTTSLAGVNVIMALICAVLIFCVRPPRTQSFSENSVHPADAPSILCSDKSATLAEQRAIPSTSPADGSDNRAATDVCESDDCCGLRSEWTPIPVWLGCCIACAGVYTAFTVLPGLVCGVTWPIALLTVSGGLLGTFVFQAVVPTTGYAVLLVPVCIIGTLSYGTAPWIPAHWEQPLLICQGAVAAAIWCGCSGLTGESFIDSCKYNSRTIILMTGCMAATIAGLITGAIETLISKGFATSINGIICLMIILLLRKIPSLMVSQRREDEVSTRNAERMLSESYGTVGGTVE